MFWLAQRCLSLPRLAGHSKGQACASKKKFLGAINRYLPRVTATLDLFLGPRSGNRGGVKPNPTVHSSAKPLVICPLRLYVSD